MRLAAILIALMLTGCVTNPYAVYRHPVTGDVLECEESTTGGGLIAIAEKSHYADCKTVA
jgi:hypothetical protein